ncbi:MAG: hypothetical protein PHS83_05920 [Clostridia bacterium]|nr:hypothetical protein [Clostridia bacterium]
MKKKGLALVVVLLCMASLLAAMAYSSAEVKAGYTIKVAKSDEALLALSFNENAAAGDCSHSIGTDGNLKITFGKVDGETITGLQSGSTYRWKGLVTLTNKSTKPIKVTVTDSVGGRLVIRDSNGAAVSKKEIAANGTLPLTFKVTVPAGAEPGEGNDLTGDIVVIATAVTE